VNKETVSYVRHIMSSDFVQLDFVNAMLAVAIIVVSFMAFVSGKTSFFGIAFILGAVLALFNMIKSFMKKSALGAFVFGLITPVLIAVAIVVYKFIPS